MKSSRDYVAAPVPEPIPNRRKRPHKCPVAERINEKPTPENAPVPEVILDPEFPEISYPGMIV